MSSQDIILNLSELLGVIAVTMIAGVTPRFKRRAPLQFKYARREGVISLVLYALILLLAVLLATPTLKLSGVMGDLPANLGKQLLLAAVCLAPFLIALMIRRQPFLSIGWKKSLFYPAFQMGAALAIMTFFLRGKVYAVMDGLLAVELTALLVLLGICLIEETIFRGFIQPRLSSWQGEIAGWLITALLFVLWSLPHLSSLASGDLTTLLFSCAVRSVLAGWIMRKSGHVLPGAFYRAVSLWILVI